MGGNGGPPAHDMAGAAMKQGESDVKASAAHMVGVVEAITASKDTTGKIRCPVCSTGSVLWWRGGPRAMRAACDSCNFKFIS